MTVTVASSMAPSSCLVKCKIMLSWRNIHVGDVLPLNISFPSEVSELMLNRIRNGSKQDVQKDIYLQQEDNICISQ